MTAWQWIGKNSDQVTRKIYAINLVIQQIENLNAVSKNAIELEKLINKKWLKMDMKEDKKKDLQQKLGSYIKAAKTNTKCRISCFWRIEKS